ncbi:MAG: outer membrane protein assembly factor BamD [Bacteroidia bacterium]
MRILVYILLSVGLLSCSKYQQLVKNGTPEEKLEAARAYHEKGDFIRAQPLFEELMTLYFGKQEREEIYYLLASSHYGLNEFLIAAYHFKNFASSYPLSSRKEQALYMMAICDYHKSLEDELDQSNTRMAINSLQSFINKYPNSEYVENCNTKIDELRKRILVKAYNGAKLYYQLGQYKAAVVACRNAIEDYPDIINRDELMFMMVDAAFIYAKNSVQKYQLERYGDVQKVISEYEAAYGKSNSYYNKVSRIKKQTEEQLELLKSA